VNQMDGFNIPNGLRAWDRSIAPILKKPFPPRDEPKRLEAPHWDRLSNWSLICEETLDTEPPPGLLAQFYDELVRRGFTDKEIQEMRHFAWLTVGWLNFEKMVWEWGHLDESDIKIAIRFQQKENLIDSAVADWMLRYVSERAACK
jgi:hypothetical protein